MKKKSLTYILISVALGIWVYVFYSIFSVVANDNAIESKPLVKRKQQDSSTFVKETYSLLVNYTDPFLKSRQSVYTATSVGGEKNVPGKKTDKSKSQKQIDQENLEAADLAFCKRVSYGGMIRNNSSKKHIAILSIENKEYMLAAGESANGVTLLKITTDSVEITCRDRKMFVHK